MKDPLQLSESPYEILGIPENSGKEAIEAAFKKQFVSSRDKSRLTNARNALSDPAQRAFTDIFLYNEDFLSMLKPPLVQPAQLLDARRSFSDSWITMCRQTMPNYALIHSLAILWHAWALYLEEYRLASLTGKPFAEKPGLAGGVSNEEAWKSAIGFWVCILNSNAFWKARREFRDPFDSAELCRRIEGYLITTFNNYAEKYRAIGDEDSVRLFQEYENLFKSEMNMSKQFISCGVKPVIRGKAVEICCGRLMLERLDLLNEVDYAVQLLVQENPGNEKLEALAVGLSEYGDIASLLTNKKYQDVIDAVEKLPMGKRDDEDVRRMLATACLEKGKQLFSTSKYIEAIDFWGRALKTGQLKDAITEVMVDSCKSKAASIMHSNPNKAIELLEAALKYISHTDIKLVLGEILVRQAVQLIMEAQNDAKNGGHRSNDEIVADIGKGIAMLEEAEKYGARDARKNLDAARLILQDAEAGLLNLDPALASALADADLAAQKGDYVTAAKYLEQALTIAPAQSRQSIKIILAQYLNLNAVNSVNTIMPILDAMEQEGAASRKLSMIAFLSKPAFIDRLFSWVVILAVPIIWLLTAIWDSARGLAVLLLIALIIIILWKVVFSLWVNSRRTSYFYPKCHIRACKKGVSYYYDLPELGRVGLCSMHSYEFNDKFGKIQVGSYMYSTILSAKKDLERAVECDPGNQQIRENLNLIAGMCNRYK